MTLLLNTPAPTSPVIQRDRPAGPHVRRGAGVVAAVTSVLAGAIHLGVAPAHWPGWRLEAAGLVAVGLAQAGVGLSLLTCRRRRGVGVVLAAVHVGAIAAWVVTRTVGWPVGPLAGQVEPIAVADVVAATAALVCLGLLRHDGGARLPRPHRRAAVTGALVVALAVGPAVALVPGVSHDPADHRHGYELPVDEHPDGLDLRRRATDPLDGTPFPVGDAPVDVAVGHGLLWVVNGRAGSVTRLTLDGIPVGTTDGVGAGATTVVAAPDAMWVAAAEDGTVARLDPTTGQVTHVVPVGGLAKGLAVGPDGAVYATSAVDSTLSRIDPVTVEVVATAPTQPDVMAAFNGPGPGAVAVAGEVVWVVHTLKRELVRFDATTLAPIGEPIPTGAGATDVLVAGDVVWVAATTSGQVWRYDRDTGHRLGEPILVDAMPEFGGGPAALASAFGDVWVLNNDERTVTRLDGRTGAVLGEPAYLSNHHNQVPRAAGIAGTGDAVWATDHDGDRIVRLDP